jgi:hypothetical protein
VYAIHREWDDERGGNNRVSIFMSILRWCVNEWNVIYADVVVTELIGTENVMGHSRYLERLKEDEYIRGKSLWVVICDGYGRYVYTFDNSET